MGVVISYDSVNPVHQQPEAESDEVRLYNWGHDTSGGQANRVEVRSDSESGIVGSTT